MTNKFVHLGRVLSKTEQKKIKGGDDGGGGCSTGPCSVYDSNTGNTYSGNCGTYITSLNPFDFPIDSICECITSLGIYQPKGGTSVCQK